jgi:hypothetical protein
MFRVPRDLVDLDLARGCFGRGNGGISLKLGGAWAILDYDVHFEDGGGDYEEDLSSRMASLTPLRAEVMRGDPRPLYLGWLLRAWMGELDEDAVEPIVPAGLGKLTAAQGALAEFLELDDDLLEVAAETSAPTGQEDRAGDAGFGQWLGALPASEKDGLLLAFCEGDDPLLAARLRRRFDAARPREPSGDAGGEGARRRTAGELLKAAEAAREAREQREAEARAKLKAKRDAEAAAARAKHLDELAGRELGAWAELERLIDARAPKAYDAAIDLLKDLRDVAYRGQRTEEFESRMEVLRAKHARKGNFIARLKKLQA